LRVVGFNLTTCETKTFSADTTPNAVVADAIRISLGIPFVFTPHFEFEKQPGGERKQVNSDYWIDGGITENYPEHIFDAEESASLGFFF